MRVQRKDGMTDLVQFTQAETTQKPNGAQGQAKPSDNLKPNQAILGTGEVVNLHARRISQK